MLRRLIGPSSPYQLKVLSYNPIAYWPLWEPSGDVAECLVNSAQNGVYTAVTLGQSGIGDGRTCPLFNGTTGYVNVYSNAFRDVFNSVEGTIMLWCKMLNLEVWTDGQHRRAFDFRGDINNRILTLKPDDNQYKLDHTGNGTAHTATTLTSTIAWFHWCMSWSLTNTETLFYFNGAEFDSTSAPTAWVIPMAAAAIGAHPDPLTPFSGWLAHCAVYDTPLTTANIADLAVV